MGKAARDKVRERYTCDTPLCQNPKHLYIGTHVDNMRDKRVRGRSSRLCGERNPRAKLTLPEVREIRLRRESGETLLAIARSYGISDRAVSAIHRRTRWADA